MQGRDTRTQGHLETASRWSMARGSGACQGEQSHRLKDRRRARADHVRDLPIEEE